MAQSSEKRKEYMRKYRLAHKEKYAAYQRKWLSDPFNREKHRETCRKYHKKHSTPESRAEKRAYRKKLYQTQKGDK